MKHKIFSGIIALELILLAVLLIIGKTALQPEEAEITSRKNLVSALMLTDFSVWTEAHYTRHPSQTDLFTPFQDFPAAIEHFPAGSIIAPGRSGTATRLEFRRQYPSP